MMRAMIVVQVHVHVLPDAIDAFREASLLNARASAKEPGVIRFDLLQRADEPARFVLVEIYRTEDDVAAHKQTAHYAAWRDTVASMMAEPRTSARFVALHPTDERAWTAS
ncbi:MAG: antibiotic biosynthesis monooxygenase [Sandaracinaceae bacterium]|nr:antibiotic biosynthesis monooxygenase [Sandaracinaceae bacterium]